MRMTGLEWRYLQKIALDHPYFDTHELPLTEKEAKAIVNANIRMTGKEFVDSVYANLGMTRPEEKKDRFAWLRRIGELLAVPPIRRIAIAVLVVILMTVFFAATPTGRAIAESVIRYISMIWVDGRIAAVRSDAETTTEYGQENGELTDRIPSEAGFVSHNITFIDSFDDFEAATGNIPATLSLPCSELYYESNEFLDSITLHASYAASNARIITSQSWGMEDYIASTDTGCQAYHADKTIYYSYDENEKIIIYRVYEDSFFMMVADDSLSIDDLVNLLNDH